MNRSKLNSRSCIVKRRPWSHRVGGFTLIELLVVIAIMSLLLGLLIPCLQMVRNMVKQKVCLGGLRSVGGAVQLYTGDHGGLFPNPKVVPDPAITNGSKMALEVRQALRPYASSEGIFCCPCDPVKPTPPSGSYEPRLTSDPKTSLANVPFPLIRNASGIIIMGDRLAGWHKPEMINVLFADFSSRQVTDDYRWDNLFKPVR